MSRQSGRPEALRRVTSNWSDWPVTGGKGGQRYSDLPTGSRFPGVKPAGDRGGLFEPAGQHHRVMVLDGGFAWEGRTYQSLSQIAKAITGTQWNGPRFFGLRDRRQAEAAS